MNSIKINSSKKGHNVETIRMPVRTKNEYRGTVKIQL